MLKITRTNSFQAAHFLPKVPEGHKCRKMHGHSYKVTVTLVGTVSSLGWIEDTGMVDHAFQHVHKQLDHDLLNQIPGLENPTTENLVVWLWNIFYKTFGDMQNITEVGVLVHEGENSTAYYDGP